MAAAKYIETPAIRALRILIQFAEGPTRNLAPLRHAGKAFLTGPTLAAVSRLTFLEIDALKNALSVFLRALASGTEQELPPLSVTVIPVVSSGRVFRFVGGDPYDALLYQVVTFAETIGRNNVLRLCPASDCQKPFIKVGRREYCSLHCQRQVYLSRYDPNDPYFIAKQRRQRSRRRSAHPPKSSSKTVSGKGR